MWAAVVLALAFCSFKFAGDNAKVQAGHEPAFDLALASWFTLTFVHLLHVLGGALTTAWLAGPAWGDAARAPAARAARRHPPLLVFRRRRVALIVTGFYLV